jgi:hypothetical protein
MSSNEKLLMMVTAVAGTFGGMAILVHYAGWGIASGVALMYAGLSADVNLTINQAKGRG